MSRQRSLLRLVLDFDGTLTKKDTMHLVAKAGYDRQARKCPPNSVTSWQDIVDAYKVDYDRYMNVYRPMAHLRTTLEEEFAFLNSLKGVENASVRRVYEAGIFDDVTAQDMEIVASDGLKHDHVQLRPGWLALVSHVLSRNQRAPHSVGEHESVQVISVNWSGWFLRSVLRNAAQAVKSSEVVALDNISIYANEIPSVSNDLESKSEHREAHRNPTFDLRTGGDKLISVLNLETQMKSHRQKLHSIYVGDSTTDLQCLTNVDVGICVRDQPLGGSQRDLADTCARLGIQVAHISEKGSIESDIEMRQNGRKPSLWWCRDFNEILTWLENHPV